MTVSINRVQNSPRVTVGPAEASTRSKHSPYNTATIIYTDMSSQSKKKQVRSMKLFGLSALGGLGYALSPQLHAGIQKFSANAGQKISLKAIQWPLGMLSLGSFMALFPLSIKFSNQHTQNFSMTNVDLEAIKKAGTLLKRA